MTDGSDLILARMMALHPKIIDLTLDRVWRLLAALDHPEEKLSPVIHIAGTNGKGSTQAMIRAGLEAMGGRVHAYTSPHLARFHERIRLAGELISEDYLTEILEECEAANGGIPITYFEITTCAALLAFARVPADWTLLEVGLGGRLDATNVVAKPRLTIITPVSVDHQQYLGETLPEIAGEKAGILKRGVPCVVGPQLPDGLEVIEARAERLGAPLLVHAMISAAGVSADRTIVVTGHGAEAVAAAARTAARTATPLDAVALLERLVRYAAGAADDFFDVPVLLGAMTPFQRRVVASCRAIPCGSTRTYGQLAASAGSPGAARAVGQVMASNRIPLIVPCHRVIAASGGLGGFSAPQGVVMKKRLLAMEQLAAAQN